MKKYILFFLFIFIASLTFAKPTITLRLVLQSENSTYNYFFASNLNGWNPASNEFQFIKESTGFYELKIVNPNVELISFKITKGTWDLVECDESGKDVSNRIVEVAKITKDTLINIIIKKWKDEFVGVPKLSTASKNVKIISDKFYLTKLGKARRIWVYTPSDYLTTNKKYAVLYMHDGQNLFDELTGPFGEWGVDECLDTLSKKINFEIIVVGIDNGGSDRLSEYSPYDFKVKPDEVNVWDVKGSGTEYLESLVNDIKPYIDSAYRTKKDSRNTSICGSSMGGLISLYAIMRYPEVFGSAGVFSPAFWTNMEALRAEINSNKNSKWRGNVYMIAGELEGKRYVDNMNEICTKITNKGKNNVVAKTIDKGQHQEIFWRKSFPAYILWLQSTQKSAK